MCLLIPGVYAAQAPGTETQITTSSWYDWEPAIGGDTIVWEHYETNYDTDIYSYNITKRSRGTVCTDPNDQYGPDVSGSLIAWYDYRNGDTSDIYLLDRSAGTLTMICGAVDDQKYPKISGHRVIWEDDRDRNGDWDLYLFDLDTDEETALVTDPNTDQDEYAIYGDIVVFSKDGDLYYTNTRTGEEHLITDVGISGHPDISGDYVVYHSRRSNINNIYLYNIQTQTEQAITSSSAVQQNPSISGNRIVWNDNRNGNFDIYMYEISQRRTSTICTAAGDQLKPDISGDYIVWQDFRAGNWDIYLYQLSDTTAPVADFIAAPRSGGTPLTVQFTDISAGFPTDWDWNFGDGTPGSHEQHPLHGFAQAGTYTVSLTAGNLYGETTETKTNYISVDAGISAQISQFIIDSDYKQIGDTVLASAQIENLYPSPYTFGIEYTIWDSGGSPHEVYDQLIEIQPGTPLVLDTVLNWTVPAGIPEGYCDGGLIVYEPSNPLTHYDVATLDDAFEIGSNPPSVSIIVFEVEEGTKYPGDTVSALAEISNDGSTGGGFSIDYSVRDPNGGYHSIFQQEVDIPPFSCAQLDDELNWMVPSTVPEGEYWGRLIVSDPVTPSVYYATAWDYDAFEVVTSPPGVVDTITIQQSKSKIIKNEVSIISGSVQPIYPNLPVKIVIEDIDRNNHNCQILETFDVLTNDKGEFSFEFHPSYSGHLQIVAFADKYSNGLNLIVLEYPTILSKNSQNEYYDVTNYGFAFENYVYPVVGFGAHCTGMSLTSMSYFLDGTHTPEKGTTCNPIITVDLVAAALCPTILQIEGLQAQTSLVQVINSGVAMFLQSSEPAKQMIIQEQIQYLRNNLGASPVPIILLKLEENHCVLAYKIEEYGDNIDIYIYDSKYPGNPNRIIPITRGDDNRYSLLYANYDSFWVLNLSVVDRYIHKNAGIVLECPVDAIIETPNGLMIDKTWNGVQDISYNEIDINGDGSLDDLINIPYDGYGMFKIWIIPENTASPDDNFTLVILSESNSIVLANQVPIQNIPTYPYYIGITEDDIVLKKGPVAEVGPDYKAAIYESIVYDGNDSLDPDGTIVSYDWDFGDGTSGTGATTSHTYLSAGTYTATLTVTDNDGLTGTDTATITVLTSSQGVDELKQVLKDMHIRTTLETKLLTILTSVQKLINLGWNKQAVTTLKSFIMTVNYQRGYSLTNEQADTLVAYANQIIASLEAI